MTASGIDHMCGVSEVSACMLIRILDVVRVERGICNEHIRYNVFSCDMYDTIFYATYPMQTQTYYKHRRTTTFAQ